MSYKKPFKIGNSLHMVTLGVLIFHTVYAETPKRGSSVCPLGDCSLKEVPLGSSIYKKVPPPVKALPQAPVEIEKPKQSKAKPKRLIAAKVIEKKSPTHVDQNPGNLPYFYQGIERSRYEMAEPTDLQIAKVDLKLPGLKSGDIIQAVIEQSIKASPSVPTPVRAMMISGPYKRSFALGQAVLDHELKRILFTFVKLRRQDTDQVYTMKAEGLSPSGQVGLEGHYESQAGKFFIGEFVAGAAAGFADATTQRNTTSFGTYVTEPSIANAGKQAGVNALSRTADRFGEQAKAAPEWTEIEGFQEIQIILEEDPIEIEG